MNLPESLREVLLFINRNSTEKRLVEKEFASSAKSIVDLNRLEGRARCCILFHSRRNSLAVSFKKIAAAEWLRNRDQDETLQLYLALPTLTDKEHQISKLEGWILGCL